MSSPEQVKPVRLRTTSFARKITPKSPLGREKDGLMAYLETVAKEGGQ
jgi:mRNA-decapping enzyme subunit 2